MKLDIRSKKQEEDQAVDRKELDDASSRGDGERGEASRKEDKELEQTFQTQEEDLRECFDSNRKRWWKLPRRGRRTPSRLPHANGDGLL